MTANIGGVKALRLSGGVCYEKYGASVYLRHIAARKDYLFNEIVYDILRCFPGGAERTVDEVTDALLEQYAVADAGAFRREVGAFLEQLADEGILTAVNGAEVSPQPSVSEQVQTACTREHRLFSAALELTYRCNERCVHCYVDDAAARHRSEELTLEEYRVLLNDLRSMGCVSLLLTGGEVFVKDCFLPVAAHASSLGMAVDIFTNGLAMTPERFDALRELNLNSISYSLYGGSPAVHDAVTGVQGSFERTLAAAMMTKCAGIDTYIKTVVMKENLSDLETLLRLGRRLDIPVSAGFAVLDTHTGRSGSAHQLTEPEDIQRALALLDHGQPIPVSDAHRTPDSPVCTAGRCSLSVNPYGEVYPCLALPIQLGNIRETPIQQIWEKSPELEQLQTMCLQTVCGRCGSCQYIDYCELCPGRVKSLPGSGTAVPNDVCILAEASQRIAEAKRHQEKGAST